MPTTLKYTQRRNKEDEQVAVTIIPATRIDIEARELSGDAIRNRIKSIICI
jgi:hypothetical protein